MPETPLSRTAVYNALPTVKVDGQENADLAMLLQSLELAEAEGGMSSLELRVSNWGSRSDGSAGFAWEDGQVLYLGAEISVSLGDVNDPQEVFKGTVTGLEGIFEEGEAPELVVLAEDALQRARMARRTALYEDTTVARLVQDVAGRLSLTPQVTGLTDTIGTRVQLNESDLAFLRRVLAEYDADVQVVDRDLQVVPRSQVQRGTLDLELHSQLRSVRVLADLSQQVTKITTAGWDPAQGQRVTGSSTGANPGPGSGRQGKEVLQAAIGARPEHVRDVAVMTRAEAQALADAAFDRRARRFVTLEGTAEGNPALRVGTQLRLSRISARWDNTYYVVRAWHRFDREKGYRTDFEAECAFIGQ